MCNAWVMHVCTGLVGPKRGKVKDRLCFKHFWRVKVATRILQKASALRAEPLLSHLGATLGSLLGIFDWPCVTLRSLWDHGGVTLCIWRSIFRVHLVSPQISMVFYNSLLVWSPFGVTFGQLLAYEGDLGALRGHSGVNLSIKTSSFMCNAGVMHIAYMYGLGGTEKGKS
jgi:hypothetical protein